MNTPPRYDANWEGDIADWEPGLMRDLSALDLVSVGTGFAVARANELTKKAKRYGRPIAKVEYLPAKTGGFSRSQKGYHMADNQLYQTHAMRNAVSDSLCIYNPGTKKWVGASIAHRGVFVNIHCLCNDGRVYSDTDAGDPDVEADCRARWAADLEKVKFTTRYLINRGHIVINMVIRCTGSLRAPGGEYFPQDSDERYYDVTPGGDMNELPEWFFGHTLYGWGDGLESAQQIMRWIEEAIAYALDYEDPTLLLGNEVRSSLAAKYLGWIYCTARTDNYYGGYDYDTYNWQEMCWSYVLYYVCEILYDSDGIYDWYGWCPSDYYIYYDDGVQYLFYRIPEHDDYHLKEGDPSWYKRYQHTRFNISYFRADEDGWDSPTIRGWLMAFDYTGWVFDSHGYYGWFSEYNVLYWRLPIPDYTYEYLNGIWSDYYQNRII